MIEWFSTVISPILGAGAGSIFHRLFSHPIKEPKEKIPPATLAAVSRRLVEVHEWQARVETLLSVQDRELMRLKAEARLNRILFDLLLLAFLASVAAALWLHFRPL